MYWYINKHVEPEIALGNYDIYLERFDKEADAQKFLLENYLPLVTRDNARESIDVRLDYSEAPADMDLAKPMFFAIQEYDYISGETNVKGEFTSLQDAQNHLETVLLPNAQHNDDVDVTYLIIKDNK